MIPGPTEWLMNIDSDWARCRQIDATIVSARTSCYGSNMPAETAIFAKKKTSLVH